MEPSRLKQNECIKLTKATNLTLEQRIHSFDNIYLSLNVVNGVLR